MRPSFHPRLINDPFSDPGLFIPFLFEKRALMFDIGDLRPLSSKDLLKVTHVFVTHTHMDHFMGFDTLLRIFLGRDKSLHLFGPPGFFERVEGKLAGYTWNLLNEYVNNFSLEVNEVHSDKIITRNYVCEDRFRSKKALASRPCSGILLEEPSFSVQGILLDHRIPCLGLSLTENFYVSILKERLREMGLPVGPWLNRFKTAVYQKKDLRENFSVVWEEKGRIIREKEFKLGELIRGIAKISPGQKITYITDVVGTSDNYRRITEIAKGSDTLFIEAAFLDSEKEIAGRKYHLTAREAGSIARKAGAKRMEIFHFSPRYKDCPDELEREAREAYGG